MPEAIKITQGRPPRGAALLFDLGFTGLNLAIPSDGSIRRIRAGYDRIAVDDPPELDFRGAGLERLQPPARERRKSAAAASGRLDANLATRRRAASS